MSSFYIDSYGAGSKSTQPDWQDAIDAAWTEFAGRKGFTKYTLTPGLTPPWLQPDRHCRSRGLNAHPYWKLSRTVIRWRGTPYCLACARKRFDKMAGGDKRFAAAMKAFQRHRAEVNDRLDKPLDNPSPGL